MLESMQKGSLSRPQGSQEYDRLFFSNLSPPTGPRNTAILLAPIGTPNAENRDCLKVKLEPRTPNKKDLLRFRFEIQSLSNKYPAQNKVRKSNPLKQVLKRNFERRIVDEFHCCTEHTGVHDKRFRLVLS